MLWEGTQWRVRRHQQRGEQDEGALSLRRQGHRWRGTGGPPDFIAGQAALWGEQRWRPRNPLLRLARMLVSPCLQSKGLGARLCQAPCWWQWQSFVATRSLQEGRGSWVLALQQHSLVEHSPCAMSWGPVRSALHLHVAGWSDGTQSLLSDLSSLG